MLLSCQTRMLNKRTNKGVKIFMPRLNENCKIICHEPDWTPNNYDLSFNPSDIPSNIPRENSSSLQKRLAGLMPVSKRIHINLSTEELTENNDLKLHTNLMINNREVDLL